METKKRLLCLGDSQSYGFGVSRQKIWTTLLEKQSGIECINAACNGNTTGGMLAYLPYEIEKHRPDAVFLMGGGNDILLSGDDATARSNMGALVHLCVKEQLMPIVGFMLSPLSSIRETWLALSVLDAASFQVMVKKYIHWLNVFCKNLNIYYIDFHESFPQTIAARGQSVEDYYLDGLHVNADGHELMADIFIEQLPRPLKA